VEIQPTTGNASTVIIDTTEPTEEQLYPDLWADMTAYNETIYAEGQSSLSCAYDYQKPSFTLKDYGLEDEVFGVISIPAMDLNMPIFLGATEKHMADGAAHLSQTSLPIGGNNTNCVIAGHRGYGGASYFRYIEKLRIGDSVTITNLWETLEYRVVQIKIIYPNEVKEILIQENRDLLTLLTCHPYASGGKQRYLVICEREN
jgi:sortase A